MEKRTRGELALLILGIVGVTGILVTGAICPGILKLVPRPKRKYYSPQSLFQAVYRLDKKGWLIARRQPFGYRIELTKRGRKELERYELGRKHLKRPKLWDKKWRLLIFDVPEKRKWQRERIRSTLRALGFYRLQDSVWAYPFECESVLELLRTKYHLRSEALYIRAEQVDNDHRLKKEFKLK